MVHSGYKTSQDSLSWRLRNHSCDISVLWVARFVWTAKLEWNDEIEFQAQAKLATATNPEPRRAGFRADEDLILLLENSFYRLWSRDRTVIAPLGYDWKIGIALILSFAHVRYLCLTIWRTISTVLEEIPEDWFGLFAKSSISNPPQWWQG